MGYVFHYSDRSKKPQSEFQCIAERFEVLERIQLDPGLPAADPTKAIWQNPPHPLSNIKSPKLPSKADIILIGSGITACAIARALLATTASMTRKPRIVVLEARTLCSGASGRNGGHLRDTPFMYFSYLKGRFGIDSAKKMSAFRSSHVSEILNVANEEDILKAAEFKEVEAVDVAMEAEKWEELKQNIDDYVKDVPSHERMPFEVWEENMAREIPNAAGALSYKAWILSTYHFITKIWCRLFEKYRTQLSIETTTPVESISTSPSNPGVGHFQVLTPRGSIECRHVVHCTNSHSAHLLPGLRSKIMPVRDQMTEQEYDIPSQNGSMDRSWIFFWNKGADYMIHRKSYENKSGALLLGGGLSHASDDGLEEIGTPRDNEETVPIAAYLSGLLPRVFKGPRNTKVLSTWTGVLGWSADLLPWVGPVPHTASHRSIERREEPDGGQEAWEGTAANEWISAGYSGEGMTLAWRCGKAVAYMILGLADKYKVEEWLPEQYRITEKRIKDADVRKLKEFY